jgi:hypothetical protein
MGCRTLQVFGIKTRFIIFINTVYAHIQSFMNMAVQYKTSMNSLFRIQFENLLP